jgi:hypothetical protein
MSYIQHFDSFNIISRVKEAKIKTVLLVNVLTFWREFSRREKLSDLRISPPF